jgi:hypothetical protein
MSIDIEHEELHSPVEQCRDLQEGDTLELEWGKIEVIGVIERNDHHHFSVRGRWRDSGQFCEFSLAKILKYGESVTYFRGEV